MAGPSVVVRVLGDLSGLSKAFKDAGDRGHGAARGLQEAFSGTLAALNRTGILGPFGEALDGVDTALEQIAKHGKQVGAAMIGVGGTLAGVGVGLAALGSKDQAAHQQLQTAVEATGASYEDYAKRVEEAIKYQERFGHSANQTQDALRILTQATGDPAKALAYLNTTADLAAAKHEDLATAATQLGKVYNGSGKILKEFGITVAKTGDATKTVAKDTARAETADRALARAKQHLADIEAIDAGKKHLTVTEAIRLRDAQQKVVDATAAATAAHKTLAQAQEDAKTATTNHGTAIDQLSQKLGGQASAAANTFGGHIAAIKAHLEDTAATLGQKYGPAITAAGSAMAVLGGITTAAKSVIGTFTKTTEAAATATEAMAAAEDTAAVSEGLALAPILLIIAALAALGVAAYLIYRNWTTIWRLMKDAVADVWDWIRNNWPLLLSILLGPIATAVYFIYKYRDQIIDAFAAVWGGIEDGWAAVVNWFGSTVGTVGQVFVDVVKAIATPFEWVFNAIAWAWNHTVGSLSFKVPSWVPGLGGQGFAMPQIPVLSFQQGGVVPYTGMIYAHQGETVIPAGKRAGPAVHIEHAHFSSDVDVEAFMRKAAWVVQTQGV